MENVISKCRAANVPENGNGIFWLTEKRSEDKAISVTTSGPVFMTKIRKLAKVRKDVIIDCEPSKDSGGFMMAVIPYDCLKLGIKMTRELTEEQRKALSERAKKNLHR